MNLQDDLLKGFANLLNPKNEDRKRERIVYASVARLDGDRAYIIIDGASIETPANRLVEVGVNDRVMVSIKDHNVVITGNISYPSITRAGDSYITLRSDGLLIGQLDNTTGTPNGTYIVVGSDTVSIYDENGDVVSTFSSNDIDIGKLSLSFDEENGALLVSVGESVTRFGFINESTSFRNEFISECDDVRGYLQINIVDKNDDQSVASFTLTSEDGGDASVTSPSGEFSVNGIQVLKRNKLVVIGTATATNIAVNANSTVILSAAISPPSGYMTVGVIGYRLGPSNTGKPTYDKNLKINELFLQRSNNTIYVKLVNHTSTNVTAVAINIQWFGLNISAVTGGGTQTLKALT